MTHYCKLCNKTVINKSKYNLLKSVTNTKINESIMRRYIILNPIFDQIDERMKRYINIYNKKVKHIRLVAY